MAWVKNCNGKRAVGARYETTLADLRFCFSLVAELSDSDQQVVTIYQCVHHSRHDEGSKHIKYGMLFDEHGCHDDRRSQDQGTDADAFSLLKAFADNGKMCTQELYT